MVLDKYFMLIANCYLLLSAFDYGNHDLASFILSAKADFHSGNNTIDILSMMVGLQVRGVRLSLSLSLCVGVSLA